MQANGNGSHSLVGQWKHTGVPKANQQGVLLKRGIRLLEKVRGEIPSHRLLLSQQPFDLHLLNWSSLYRRSREIYAQQGGGFLATLVTSPRTLSASLLLDQMIEYSPIERELVWSALDPIESKNLERLLTLRTYSSNLFHEQNHRILWELLPSAPLEKTEIRKYLNFAESLVITLDMALGDQLGPELSSLFYLTGVTYDPGTSVRHELPKRREYRNYLQAALHATYLNLELYDPFQIPGLIRALFPHLGEFAERAAVRSGRLDPAFIQKTNLRWQKQHSKAIVQKLCRPNDPALKLSSDPFDNRQQYLIAEKWFESMGL